LLTGALMLIVAATPMQRLRGSFPTEMYFHSDIAFLPALFRDVAGRGSLSSWGLPEAPYFVPDWPLYLVAWSLTPTYSSGLALFALFQIGLLAFLWLGLMKHLSRDPLVATVLGVGALVGAGLAGRVPADYASVSFAHFGTFLLTVGGLVLFYRYHFGPPMSSVEAWPQDRPERPLAHDQRRRLLGAIFVLACLGTASDRLFVAWWVVPVVGIEMLSVLGHFAGRLSSRARDIANPTLPCGSWRLAATAVAGTAGGLLVHDALVRSSGNYGIRLRTDLTVQERLRSLVKIFIRPELSELWPLFSIAVAAAAVGWIWMSWSRRAHKPTVVFVLWFSFATVATLTAEALTMQPGWRFHQFMYHVPILMIGAWLPGLVRRCVLTPSRLAVVASLSLFSWGALPISDLSLSHTPDEVSCLDEVLARSGSRVGIGNYAVSRLAVVHSTFDLDVGTRNSWMAPEEDVHSRAWARTSADFAILHPTIFGTMPENTIRSLSANDPTETVCGHWRVLDFGPGGIDLDRLTKLGASAYAPGCWYTNSIGTPDPRPASSGLVGNTCALRVNPAEVDQGAGQYIGHGSRYEVTPGSYQLSALLSEGEAAAGTFEVAIWEANTGTLHAVHSAPLSNPRLTIEVSDTDPELSLEPRILYQGGTPLVLEGLTISRTG
jgi:hypothetical protein